MPKNKFQEIVFTIMMSIAMVVFMEMYNGYFRDGAITMAGVFIMLKEMTYIVPIVFVLSYFVGDPLAGKLTMQNVDVKTAPPLFVIYVRAIYTVTIMCPAMSMVATLIFKHPTPTTLIPIWLVTVATNFPCALISQIMFCGPLVRFLFRKMFANQ